MIPSLLKLDLSSIAILDSAPWPVVGIFGVALVLSSFTACRHSPNLHFSADTMRCDSDMTFVTDSFELFPCRSSQLLTFRACLSSNPVWPVLAREPSVLLTTECLLRAAAVDCSSPSQISSVLT